MGPRDLIYKASVQANKLQLSQINTTNNKLEIIE